MLRGSTGLGWDPVKMIINMPEEWWTRKLKEIPKARKLKNKGPLLPDDQHFIFQGSLATGEQSWSSGSCQMPPDLEDSDGEDESAFQTTPDLGGLSEGDGIDADGVNTEPPRFTTGDNAIQGYNLKKRKVLMREKIASSIDEMVRFWKEKSAAASSASSGSSAAQDDVDVCLHLLERLPGVDYSSDLYRFVVVQFMKPEFCRVFMKFPNEETRKQFISDAMRADNAS